MLNLNKDVISLNSADSAALRNWLWGQPSDFPVRFSGWLTSGYRPVASLNGHYQLLRGNKFTGQLWHPHTHTLATGQYSLSQLFTEEQLQVLLLHYPTISYHECVASLTVRDSSVTIKSILMQVYLCFKFECSNDQLPVITLEPMELATRKANVSLGLPSKLIQTMINNLSIERTLRL